jgi:hypothetical protein
MGVPAGSIRLQACACLTVSAEDVFLRGALAKAFTYFSYSREQFCTAGTGPLFAEPWARDAVSRLRLSLPLPAGVLQRSRNGPGEYLYQEL